MPSIRTDELEELLAEEKGEQIEHKTKKKIKKKHKIRKFPKQDNGGALVFDL